MRPLSTTAVTPNQITVARLATGIAAALALGVGDSLWRDLGAGIFVLSLILDRADGELARLSGRTSAGGHKFDLIADAISNALIFVGLGVGLANGAFGPWAIPMGMIAGAAVVTVLWMVMAIERTGGARAAEVGGGDLFDPDDGMLAVPILIWIGAAEGLLVAATFGASAFAAYFAWRFRTGLFRRHA